MLPFSHFLESVVNKASLLFLTALAVTASFFRPARADELPSHYVRVAELDIDPAQLDAYKLALKEEMDASVRLEPGVIGLFAVAEKDSPARIRILELYADEAGYQKHLLAPHFLKYKDGTQAMVKSLNLLETNPILLTAKGK